MQAAAQVVHEAQLNDLQSELDDSQEAAVKTAAALRAAEVSAEEAATKAEAVAKAKHEATEEIADLESQMKEQKSKHRYMAATIASCMHYCIPGTDDVFHHIGPLAGCCYACNIVLHTGLPSRSWRICRTQC